MKFDLKVVGASIMLLMSIYCLNPAAAQDLKLADDITKETIVGPGSIAVRTEKDILMSFGATTRMIPTAESDWDFGMNDEVDSYLDFSTLVNLGLLPAEQADAIRLNKNFFKDHFNESGWVNDNYIRNETKLHFNALPKDRKWSFYAALEFDRPLETTAADSRGGKDSDTSDFGLERLHGTMALPYNLRLHAGWDVWHMDAFEGAGLVYGDDNPGFWLTGDYETIGFNAGYFKLSENDFQTGVKELSSSRDDDRDLLAGYVTWEPDPANKLQLFYAFDRIRSVPTTDLLGALTAGTLGITGDTPDTNSHHLGGYYIRTLGAFEIFTEGVYQFGSADDTGLAQDDYDISAYALAADVSFQFKGILTGFPFKPHIGIMYTSGDDDPDDDELGGYNGVANAQRFSQRWGGENTIVGDTNLIFGSLLYGYLPELYGNGTPVFTGGLQNATGFGGGRGDNPGLTMISIGLTTAPREFLIYKTNVNMFRWNEDFQVADFVNTEAAVLGLQPLYSDVDAGYAGSEWDNEITLALSKNIFIKGQAAFFFPGSGIEDVTEARGAKSDDMASRIAAELIWNF